MGNFWNDQGRVIPGSGFAEVIMKQLIFLFPFDV